MEENELHYHMKVRVFRKEGAFGPGVAGADASCGRDGLSVRSLPVHGDGVFQGDGAL